MTKKLILSLDLHDDKDKQRAMKAVTSLTGIGSVSVDMKEKKLTVIGEVDPVDVVAVLRKKHYFTEVVSFGPEKTEEKKKEEPKKDDKKKSEKDELAEIINAYKAYHPHLTTHYYVQSVEENPNACVIC